jgi:homoserine kinase
MSNIARVASAFAPAGVGNVAVGFDLIGHALDAKCSHGADLGDTVTVTLTDTPEVQITAITGLPISLPSAAHENTAGRAVLAFQRALGLAHGFEIAIHKGIPLGSGLGGSAASAVAAVVAANAACGAPLELAALYPFALEGECAASGAKHGDNVGPQLLGGLCFTNAERCIRLPVLAGLTAVVVHPNAVLETKTARAALAVPFRISEFVAQSDKLAGFLIALYENDISLLRSSLADVLVEPKRAPLIPGFAAVKQAALDLGAIGASISGAGPSVFAWFSDRVSAERASFNMKAAFAAAGLSANAYVAPVAGRGARLVGL